MAEGELVRFEPRISVLGRREAALAHLLGIFARCRPDFVAQAAIPLDECRGELGEEAEHVADGRGGGADDRDRRLASLRRPLFALDLSRLE